MINLCGYDPDLRQNPAKILIVDDSKLTREMLRAVMLKFGYKIVTAQHGREAIEALTAAPDIDLIILDLVMPVMNGFEFLQWRAERPEVNLIPVIVSSSLDDFDAITIALSMNSYDYFTKPLTERDMEVTLPLKITNAVATRRLMLQTRRQNELLNYELEMAARYQQFLLPRDVNIQGVKVAYQFEPCSGVGGDYFDFFELSRDEVGMVVADVSGHGVASAMTATIIKALIPRYLEIYKAPSAALLALNDDLLRLTPDDVFVTAFAGVYRPASRQLIWSTAGHPSPILARKDRPASLLGEDSPILGFFASDDATMKLCDQLIDILPDDRLVLYTDGLIEAKNQADVMFGVNRLTHLVGSGGGLPADALKDMICQELFRFVGGPINDDVAIIVLDF